MFLNRSEHLAKRLAAVAQPILRFWRRFTKGQRKFLYIKYRVVSKSTLTVRLQCDHSLDKIRNNRQRPPALCQSRNTNKSGRALLAAQISHFADQFGVSLFVGGVLSRVA